MGMRNASAIMDRIYLGMGYICGIEILMLALFIVYQVIARKVNWVMAPGMHQMSGYVLAMAVTWAFSYSLRTGSHVRIDALLSFMPRPLRWVADWVALGSILFFTSVTAWKTWIMVLMSYDLGAVSTTYPLTPLWIPQMVVAIGFSMLGATAMHMMVDMIGEAALPVLHRWLGGSESYRAVEAQTAPIEEGSASAL
jgi:TRAP-type mannitol/chloroaromatic compound transport system permease small subunit